MGGLESLGVIIKIENPAHNISYFELFFGGELGEAPCPRSKDEGEPDSSALEYGLNIGYNCSSKR